MRPVRPAPSCDSLMDFMHKELAREVDPRDGRPPDNVFIYWMDVKEGQRPSRP